MLEEIKNHIISLEKIRDDYHKKVEKYRKVNEVISENYYQGALTAFSQEILWLKEIIKKCDIENK